MDRLILVLLFGLATPAFSSDICHDRMNIILPKVVVSGQSSATLVHFHSKHEQHNVTLRLVRLHSENSSDVLAQNTVTIRGKGTARLNIPNQDSGLYDFQVLFDCVPKEENCSSYANSKVKLTGSIRDVIIRPTSNYYRPGETIEFWILAVDHNLHAPTSTMAKLYIRDSRGRTQGVWEDIPLFEGTKKFEFLISERAPLGKWTIEVRTEGNLYSSELNVSLARGSNQLPNREQVVTEKHFVELHFSDKMRRKYKPGLPLMGKVEAVSSEEEVRVRVKVIDDQRTVLYSQDIDLTGREGTFIVPAVITNTDQITVQAELISLDGKDVDSQYVLARETLSKWNSESNCYLLIKDSRTDLKPDEDVEMTVLTSCPCSNDMHYVISTEGRITALGELTLTNQTNVPVVLDSIMQGVNIYEFNISFRAEAQMAPISNILVYYIAESGEIIGDSISFNVKLQHEKVNIFVSENNLYYAHEEPRIGLQSFPKTHICLVGGRIDDTHFWNRRQSRFDRQSLEDNLTFLTSCKRAEETLQLPKHESYFPSAIINQLWLWKCFNYTDETDSNTMTLPAPNGTEKWNLWALSLSDAVELRISAPVTINVFSPINVHFELPTPVKVMEIVQVEITISNNMKSCVDIHALIAVDDGVIYPGIDVSLVSEKLRLGGHGATSIVVRVQPVTAGSKTMTAYVSSYVRENCEEPANPAEDLEFKALIVGNTTTSRTFEATNGGIQKVHTENSYFCANEDIIYLEPESIHYKFVSASRKFTYIIFDVFAESGFHIALAENENSTDNIYQIHLGDYSNRVSWIGRGKYYNEIHLTSDNTPDLLSGVKYQTFWLTWDDSVINVGKGSIVGDNSLLTHIMDEKMKIYKIGFATSAGIKGEVRISQYNDEAGYSQVLRLDLLNNFISGTESGTVFVTGGLAIPLAAQQLKPQPTTRPFSSLAAALSSFADVLLEAADILNTKWIKVHYQYSHNEAYEKTQKHIQNLLTYMQEDFSFSDHPNITDFANTVKAFEILSLAQYTWNIDYNILIGIRKWICDRQYQDGHFETGNNDTMDEKLLITAQTLSVFLEIDSLNDIDRKIVDKGYRYLEANVRNLRDSYTASALCYTFSLYKNDSLRDDILRGLWTPIKSDQKYDDWPNSRTSSGPFDWLFDKETRTSDEEVQKSTNRIAEYKTAIYVALVYTLKRDIREARTVIQYLMYRADILDEHPELSYSVTKALVTFASLSRDVHSRLTVSMATSGMELTDTLELSSRATLIDAQHSLGLPSLPTKVFIYATGAGCATIQSEITYLTFETKSVPSFDFVSFIEEEIPAHYNVVGDPEGLYPQLILKSCFRLEKPSKGLKIEVILFSGYRLDSVLSVSPANVDFTHGFTGEKTWFTFANITANCGVCVRYLVQSSFIISALRPMYFRMYELEYPQITRELFVHSMNKDSLLRTDIIDAHFVTWFGSQTDYNERDSDFSRFEQCSASTSYISSISTSSESRNVPLNITQEKTTPLIVVEQPEDSFIQTDYVFRPATGSSFFEVTQLRNRETGWTIDTAAATTSSPLTQTTATDLDESSTNNNSFTTTFIGKTTTELVTQLTQVPDRVTVYTSKMSIPKLPSTTSTVRIIEPVTKPTKKKKAHEKKLKIKSTTGRPSRANFVASTNESTKEETISKNNSKTSSVKGAFYQGNVAFTTKSIKKIAYKEKSSTDNSTNPTSNGNDDVFVTERTGSYEEQKSTARSSSGQKLSKIDDNSTIRPVTSTTRSKDVKKVVVSQDELTVASVTKSTMNTSEHLSHKKALTVNELWDTLNDVSSETRRRATLS